MNILIIDDDTDKKTDIYNQLMEFDSNARIRWFNNYQDASRFINDNSKYIDLIMLDWCFPANSYSRCQYGMGKQILSFMKYNDLDNKVIICSSDLVSINKNEYPFVLGSILYSYQTSFVDEISDLLNVERKTESMVKTIKPKKPNTDSGYKRHKSSQPWWQK